MSPYRLIQTDEFQTKLKKLAPLEPFKSEWPKFRKIVKGSPTSCGGKYHDQWAYRLFGYHIMAKIDEANKTVYLRDLVRLPR